MNEKADQRVSRREARKAERCRAIVEVASREFREHGYAGATMSSIAAAVGGSKGTLWSHFPSKDDLFIAVVDHLASSYQEEFAILLKPAADVEAALRRFCGEYVKKVAFPDNLSFYRMVISDVVRFPEIGRIFHDHAIRRTRVKLEEFLRDAMERGQLRRDDPEQAARHLIGLCFYVTHQEALLGLTEKLDAEKLARHADSAVSLFLRAYAAEDAA